MKKLIALILAVVMTFSLTSVAFGAEDSFKITVATDLHYNHDGATSAPGRYSDKAYSHATMSGALRIESAAIIDAFLAEAAKDESQAVLLAGDLADTGSLTEQAVVAAKLTAFEKETGKQVYVVPGNHDYAGTTPDEFKAIYHEFGYAEAIARDENSASYVADIGDDYRLLAIDSCEYKVGVCAITAERVEWIRIQAERARAEGKKTIAMMHHNLLNHFALGDILFKGAYVDPALGLAEIFAENNVKYTFVGHTHSQDIKAYTGKNGVTVYDVLTSSLNTYPCPYRMVTFGEKTKIQTRKITCVDASCLKDIVAQECYNLAAEDFPAYALTCLDYGYDMVADSYLKEAKIKSILGLDAQKDKELCELIDELTPAIRELFFMPLYKADEAEKGKSMEALAGEFDLSIPETEYESFAELFIGLYKGYTFGDESFGLFSDEYKIFVASVTVMLNTLLKDVSAEDYAAVLSFICNFLGVDKAPAFFIGYAADGISRARGIDILMTTVVSALILTFTTDEAPGDNNVTLEGFGAEAVIEEELTLLQKVQRFFISIFDFILRLFGVGK